MNDKLAKWSRIFLIWGIVATVVWVVLALYFKPWGTEMGAPGSPQRTLLMQVTDWWVLKLPWFLLLVTKVMGKSKWLAPRGRYQEGVEYKLFTPYNYTAIAIMAALFAVSGISSFQAFDLPSAPAAIAAIYFNPVIAWASVWIGGTLRALVFGSGEPVSWFLTTGMSDGFQYIILSMLYWWFSETRWGAKLWARAVWWFVIYYIVPTVTLFTIYFWAVPSSMYVPIYTDFLVRYIPTGQIAGLAGLFVAEAMIRATKSRRKPVVPTG